MKHFIWQRIRFGVRKALRALPRKKHVRIRAEANRVWILFTGTYGDFVQVLPMLHEATRFWPKAKILLWAPKRYIEAFGFALPVRTWQGRWWQLVGNLCSPADLVLMNAVCVYRLRYEILSLRLGRAAAGFRYADEPFRPGLGWSVPLTPDVANFAEVNYELPRAVAASKLPTTTSLPWRARIDPTLPFPFEGPVLFSVGSAGFKQAVGLTKYIQVIDAVMAVLDSFPVTFVAGPEDGDVLAHLVQAYPQKACWQISIEQLGEKLPAWPGSILGFNSFMAHFALYLGRRMVVLHYEKVPHGYDCSPFHHQLVLTDSNHLGMDELRDFLSHGGRLKSRQELPGQDRGR